MCPLDNLCHFVAFEKQECFLCFFRAYLSDGFHFWYTILQTNNIFGRKFTRIGGFSQLFLFCFVCEPTD